MINNYWARQTLSDEISGRMQREQNRDRRFFAGEISADVYYSDRKLAREIIRSLEQTIELLNSIDYGKLLIQPNKETKE